MIYKCSRCGCQMIKEEVWISDDMKDEKLFCYSHAPDDAIRLKDTIKPRIQTVKKGGIK